MNEHAPRDKQQDDQQQDKPERDSLSLWQLLTSALAAAFGVQSSRNRERDFTKGRPVQFIAIGIILTVGFVLAVMAVVNLVLSNVGPHP